MGFLLAVGTFALAGACGGDDRPAAPDTPAAARGMDSTEVLAFIAAVDQSEVQAAQLGTRRASNTEVRQFAQLLWREHAQSGRDVSELARQLEIDLRASGQASRVIANLRTTSQQAFEQLNRVPKGPGFDRAFLESQVRAHQALLQDLRRIVGDSSRRVSASLAPGGGVDVGVTGRPDPAEAAAAASRAANRKAENPDEAARMMLMRVQQHLERARQVQSRLAGGAAGGAPARR